MSLKKKNRDSGVITFHTPFPASLLKLEADVQDATGRRESPSQPSARMRSSSKSVTAGKRDEASPSGPQPGANQDWLSHTSLRRLQAKMEAENQQAIDIIQPLLDTENGLVKELERFLCQRDVAELRRRELLHKRWTERVWFPLQRRVEEQVSSRSPVMVKRRQILYSHYLHHCNTKGFVFLESYDVREYNPFLLHITDPHYFKGKKLPQSDRPLSEPVMSQRNKLLQASSNHPATASRKPPVEEKTEARKSSRLDTVPYHIRAIATPDGRCHQSGCWFSIRGCRQPASSQQLQPSPTSK